MGRGKLRNYGHAGFSDGSLGPAKSGIACADEWTPVAYERYLAACARLAATTAAVMPVVDAPSASRDD